MTDTVLLLAGMTSDGYTSMDRYARELFAALRRVQTTSRTITLEQYRTRRYVSALVPHRYAQRIDRAWSRYVAYPRSLRTRAADVFHILDHGYAHLIRALDAERTVVTCHDIIPLLAAKRVIAMDVPAAVRRTFKARVACLARARTVITNSSATRETLIRHTSVAPERIVVIPYGLNPIFHTIPGTAANPRVAVGIPDASRLLLQVATHARYKNTPAVLRAFAQVRTRIPDARLVRIGTPFYSDEAQLAERLGIVEAITCLGVIASDRQLVQWYHAADVLVFPSLWEGFGWPPLEAMACGTPVVASRIPAIAEVVGDAGLLVEPEDSSALAEAVERVLMDPGLAESLRVKGRERARRFTWEQAAARTLTVYDTILQ